MCSSAQSRIIKIMNASKITFNMTIVRFRLFLVASLCFFSSCTTQLAPKYDAAIFDSLIQTNVKIMQFFASVSEGTESTSCNQRESNYNSMIGSMNALAIQSKARPMPDNSITKKVSQVLKTKGLTALDDGVAPSASALEEVAKQLTKMKQVDCRSGLSPIVVSTFKNAVIISMDQAITYESFLER